MTDYRMRLDLDRFEYELLLRVIKNSDFDSLENDIAITLNEKIQNPKKIEKSVKKYLASSRATEARTKRAKEKIQNAINLLQFENKNITAYAIAKESGVSYNTVKKYYLDK